MTQDVNLPGFRFHPTEEELLEFYLKLLVFGKRERFDIIGFLNIYLHDPQDLPGLAKIGEREWYFFVPRDRKHGNGGRPNRITENGYWKATGSDRRILSLSSNPKRLIGLRKTLVFYKGRAPKGEKTEWIMNEYRLPSDQSPLPKDIVLCKIYKKATPLKELEQRAANEEKMENFFQASSSSMEDVLSKTVEEKKDEKVKENKGSSMSIQVPLSFDELTQLQVPNLSVDWTQDSSWIHFNSPWPQSLTPLADILNF